MMRLNDTLASIQDTLKKVSFGVAPNIPPSSILKMGIENILPSSILKMGIEISLSMEKEKKKMDELKEELDWWHNLHKALKVQDVSLKSIQRFQHFRFHCSAGYLTPPFGT